MFSTFVVISATVKDDVIIAKEGTMTLTQFTAFSAVAKHLNLTKAAQMLHVSQPSLSKHLKVLEENFRLRIFTRHPTGIRLTDEGYEFFHEIKTDPAIGESQSALSERNSAKAQRSFEGQWQL